MCSSDLVIGKRAVEAGQHGVSHRHDLVVGRAVRQAEPFEQRGVNAGQNNIVAGVAITKLCHVISPYAQAAGIGCTKTISEVSA